MKKVLLFIALLYSPITVFAEAGPPIPRPKVSIENAIKLAKQYFENQWKNSKSIKTNEWILDSVEYTNNFDLESDKNMWAWKIRFVHPIQNDHTATYQVTNEGKILEQEMTK